MATAQADTTHNIFIAIDFGTTKSGYAFALGEKKEIRVQPETKGEKMDTILLLNSSDNSLHSFGKEAWDFWDFWDLRKTRRRTSTTSIVSRRICFEMR